MPQVGAFSVNGVACVGAEFCVAVGSSQSKPIILRFTGSRWTLVKGATDASGLYAVSCTSISFCEAVGEQGRLGVQSLWPFSESWNGRSWKSSNSVRARESTELLVGVSCWSSSGCMEIGSQGSNENLAEKWNGSKWSVVPSGAGTLDGVACSSAANCTAVGDNFVVPALLPLIEWWNGTAWRTQKVPSVGRGALLGIWSSRVFEVAVGHRLNSPTALVLDSR